MFQIKFLTSAFRAGMWQGTTAVTRAVHEYSEDAFFMRLFVLIYFCYVIFSGFWRREVTVLLQGA